jgi:vanadium-dependent haloperoxidase-like protein
MKGTTMNPLTQLKKIRTLPLLIAVALVLARSASATLPPGNTAAQWNTIAENTVVGSGAFQGEGYIYMAYASAAVYDAVVAIEGGFQPYGPPITASPGASVDCAVIEAAYRTLVNYFPSQAGTLGALYTEALSNFGGCTSDGGRGTFVGQTAATNIITLRTGDGRMTPIGTTSSFPTLPPAPGVWRLTPPFALAQTPWVGNVRPFIVRSPAQFLPDPPPSLLSDEWVEAFDQTKAYGAANGSLRSDEQTFIAKFWSANVIRQYNRVGRDISATRGLSLLDTARLAAMVNVVAADAMMSMMHAKYHYLFWRPVTAINGSLDPSAVTNDGFGPVPGYDDGNPATVEQAGWRPLLTTPNHPEFPSAHCTITSAMAEVFRTFLETSHIDLDIHGFDPAGPPGNLNAVRHFDMPNELRQEVINARIWAGLHYHFSCVAGAVLGRQVANFDLSHAFQPVE